MALSLKISNIIGNELELIQRLKKVNSPGKKALLIALKTNDYTVIYKELLFRIELYSENKVLNYTKQDINTIVTSLRKVGIDVITNELIKKYIPVAQQQFIAPTEEIIQPEVFKQQVNNIDELLDTEEISDIEDISGCSPKKAFDILYARHSVVFENITLAYNNQTLQISRYFNERKRSFGTQFKLNDNNLIKTEKFKNFKDFSKKCVDEIIKAVIQNKIDTEKVSKINVEEEEFIENQEIGNNSDIVKIKDYISQNSELYVSLIDEDEQELMASTWIGYEGERYIDEAKNLLDKIMEMFPTFIGKVSTRGKYVYLNIVIDGPDKILNESAGDYKVYFLNKLQDFGVESPAELSTEDKTKFFNEISDEWESQSLNESKDFLNLDESFDNLFEAKKEPKITGLSLKTVDKENDRLLFKTIKSGESQISSNFALQVDVIDQYGMGITGRSESTYYIIGENGSGYSKKADYSEDLSLLNKENKEHLKKNAELKKNNKESGKYIMTISVVTMEEAAKETSGFHNMYKSPNSSNLNESCNNEDEDKLNETGFISNSFSENTYNEPIGNMFSEFDDLDEGEFEDLDINE